MMIELQHTAVYTNIHDAFIWSGYKPADIVPVNPIQTTDLPGTTAGTVTLPAYRLTLAG